ncbi:MFS transporter [Arthrobacter sp. KFRI-F3372]|uniref:MFS transporter n=1 Tax=Arthrobacter oryzae TaxID=409290 RepID=UPI00278711D8|nr:MFS transporter [Arthrobacter oryzae]MDP9989016.1 MFS family permease [Arthrobacter oryzae]WHP61082.1 MFS transporter [Arthrobacter sp. KFRI-F3372]
MLSVLRDVTYRRLFAAQVIALLGTGLLTVALGLLAFDLAGKDAGAVMGTALTVKMLAYVGLAPVINALVARLPKKPVLIGADLIRAGMALCLPFITEAWQIYVVIFLLQSASATFTPAFQSLIPAVLKQERDYTRALSLSRLAYDLEALASPAIAALLLGVLSYNKLFLGTVGGFLFSAFMVIITTLPATGTQAGEPSSLWHRTTLGARIFWRTPRLRSLLALNLVVSAPTALVLVNSVVVVRDVLHRPATDLALALACFGIGSMLVALGASRLLERLGDRAVMLTGAALIPAALAGATALLFLPAGAATWWWLLGLWFLLGAGNSTILTPSSRLLREASTEETRPYVFTAQFSLSHACYIISYPLAGIAGAAVGLGPAALALTLLAMIGAAGAFLSWPRRTAGAGPAESLEQGDEQSAGPRPQTRA